MLLLGAQLLGTSRGVIHLVFIASHIAYIRLIDDPLSQLVGDNVESWFIGTYICNDHSAQRPTRLLKLQQLHPLIQLKQHYEWPS